MCHVLSRANVSDFLVEIRAIVSIISDSTQTYQETVTFVKKTPLCTWMKKTGFWRTCCQACCLTCPEFVPTFSICYISNKTSSQTHPKFGKESHRLFQKYYACLISLLTLPDSLILHPNLHDFPKRVLSSKLGRSGTRLGIRNHHFEENLEVSRN